MLGDPDRLGQVLDHLLGNAVKFTAAGRIVIKLEREATGSWRIAVSDTGVGFDPADAERLFASFELGDASATREHGGAGLGLAICRRLAGLMGGRIEADGAPGAGAVFTLSLPLPEAGALPTTADRPLSVLLADDHPTNRKVVELILGAVGAEVTSVQNGAEAVIAAGQDGVDLILMDLQMPVMDGLTAITEIRRAEAAGGRPRRPIDVLSANSSAADVEASHRAGADGHLGKPIRPDVLLAAYAEATAVVVAIAVAVVAERPDHASLGPVSSSPMAAAAPEVVIVPGVVRVRPEHPAVAPPHPRVVPVGRGVGDVGVVVEAGRIAAHDIPWRAAGAGGVAAGTAGDHRATCAADHRAGDRAVTAPDASADQGAEQAADDRAGRRVAMRLDTVLLRPVFGVGLVALVLPLLVRRLGAGVVAGRRRRRRGAVVARGRLVGVVAGGRTALIVRRRAVVVVVGRRAAAVVRRRTVGPVGGGGPLLL